MWILIVGNPIEGFTYYGPYGSTAEAVVAGEQVEGGDWWIVPLGKRTI